MELQIRHSTKLKMWFKFFGIVCACACVHVCMRTHCTLANTAFVRVSAVHASITFLSSISLNYPNKCVYLLRTVLYWLRPPYTMARVSVMNVKLCHDLLSGFISNGRVKLSNKQTNTHRSTVSLLSPKLRLLKQHAINIQHPVSCCKVQKNFGKLVY
jgi:hypothetical protein